MNALNGIIFQKIYFWTQTGDQFTHTDWHTDKTGVVDQDRILLRVKLLYDCFAMSPAHLPIHVYCTSAELDKRESEGDGSFLDAATYE